MRFLTGSGTGLWVFPAIGLAFVAYLGVVGRLVHRAEGGKVVGFASRAERKAA